MCSVYNTFANSTAIKKNKQKKSKKTSFSNMLVLVYTKKANFVKLWQLREQIESQNSSIYHKMVLVIP